jgi:hypothetical protein
MKTTTYAIVMTAIAISATLGNGYWLRNAHNTGLQLDACAKSNNVYACKIDFVPVEEPRVVYKQAALLPPPAL